MKEWARKLIEGKRIGIVGLGPRSGIPAAEILSDLGGKVFGSEKRREEELKGHLEGLRSRGVELEFDDHSEMVLAGTDFIVVSPGVPIDIPVLQKAGKNGIPVYSEIEIAYWLADAPIVAVTGSNGKTTTTALLGRIFEEGGQKVEVGGNIGVSLCKKALDIDKDGVLIAEVSSFQLERIWKFQPHVSILLNISPDHLDRHPSFDYYCKVKGRIFENQDAEDFAVVNSDDERVLDIMLNCQARILRFSLLQDVEEGACIKADKIVLRLRGESSQVCGKTEVGIKGDHNLVNSLAAITAGGALGINPVSMGQTVKIFKGVEHRLEFVVDIDGVRFINDSKATNVDATACALRSFEEPIVLIAGGRDKQGDFAKLRPLIKEKVKSVILIGEATPKIEDLWKDIVAIRHAQSIEDAVSRAKEIASSGDVVLLAPACASFDMFKDYEDRGRKFKKAVLKFATGKK